MLDPLPLPAATRHVSISKGPATHNLRPAQYLSIPSLAPSARLSTFSSPTRNTWPVGRAPTGQAPLHGARENWAARPNRLFRDGVWHPAFDAGHQLASAHARRRDLIIPVGIVGIAAYRLLTISGRADARLLRTTRPILAALPSLAVLQAPKLELVGGGGTIMALGAGMLACGQEERCRRSTSARDAPFLARSYRSPSLG